MDTPILTSKIETWHDRPVFSFIPKFSIETLLVVLIILAAVVSRFYNVGLRVMSHDEVNHVVPSYDLYTGKGYSHDPVTHGPLQFHLLAASYFLLGDSDFSSRVPSALFSIATIVFVLFAYRRYLGRTGALLAGFFYVISPFLLFYGRYTRNESFIGLFGVIMLYAVLRYLEKGKPATLLLYTTVLALHFCSKETSFIYTAAMLIFLAVLFLKDVTQHQWKKPANRDIFILVTIIALLLIGIALGAGVLDAKNSKTAIEAADAAAAAAAAPSLMNTIKLICIGLAGVSLLAAIYFILTGLGWNVLRSIRSFDLLLLTFTIVLPQLIAFPMSWLGWNPLDYTDPGLIRTSIFLAVALVISVTIGLLWKPAIWISNAGLFYGLFTIFYTTVFTNGQGFFTGMVGSLGYWLSQQGVNRGTQPWYYYAFLQIPMYEYLAALGTIVAFVVGIKHRLFSTVPGVAPAFQPAQIEPSADTSNETGIELESETPSLVAPEIEIENNDPQRIPVLSLLLYWSVACLLAFSAAGEKMPWLSVHIAMPMLLAAGFGIGYFIDSLPKIKIDLKAALGFLLLPVLLISLSKTLGLLVGPDKPFSGNTLEELQITSTFIFSLLASVLSGWGIYKLQSNWDSRNIFKSLSIAFFAILAVLTARSAFQANYINYDNGKEYLVYAHGARGPKDVLEQVEDISLRTTGGKDIQVAYIGDALYPYWWYFRDYPNKTWLKDQLTRDLLQYPVVISDDEQLMKTKAILKDAYTEFQYKRLVWPMQDYFNITWERIWASIKNPNMLKAIFEIWMNKDYSEYADIKSIGTLTVENWQPSGNIHLFVKKDIISSIWSYGSIPVVEDTVSTDPYAEKFTTLTPDQFLGSGGSENGQLNIARDIAIGKNGNIYVADAGNHRIQQFAADGTWVRTWGSYANVDSGNAPGGTFNEPWGIAVGPDGSVYVADTWNYRIQKFTADGKFVTMWGTSGTADAPTTFWGPRGIVVNKNGNVLITDTGNNRVVVFDKNGNYLNQFGLNGINAGEFDEPVGLAVDKNGNLYVVDTWNQRIQVFLPLADGVNYQPLREWSVSAWTGQSINNKPFIDVDSSGNVFVTDPDAYRVLEFDSTGEFIRGWGDYSSGLDGFGMPVGIAVDGDDRVWISDSENNYLLRFTLPQTQSSLPEGLPALPASSIQITYNLASGFVENPLQEPVYRLDSDAVQWIPVVPENISSIVGSEAVPTKSDDGYWKVSDPANTKTFEWNADMLIWVALAEINPTSTN